MRQKALILAVVHVPQEAHRTQRRERRQGVGEGLDGMLEAGVAGRVVGNIRTCLRNGADLRLSRIEESDGIKGATVAIGIHRDATLIGATPANFTARRLRWWESRYGYSIGKPRRPSRDFQ